MVKVAATVGGSEMPFGPPGRPNTYISSPSDQLFYLRPLFPLSGA